tara:strand:+ start:1082 stop:1420 length:339 start_codon:yes stop_codon:yes gene_type:complete
MKTWTDAENRFLRKAYNNEPISKIAKALLRSEQSIRNHVHVMRIKGMAFDRKRDVQNKPTQHFHPTEHDESDDIEAAKSMREERLRKETRRRIIWNDLAERDLALWNEDAEG